MPAQTDRPTPDRAEAAPSTLVRAIAMGEVLRVRIHEFRRTFGHLDSARRLTLALDDVEAMLREWRNRQDRPALPSPTGGPSTDATQAMLDEAAEVCDAQCPDRPSAGGCLSDNGEGWGPCRYCGRDVGGSAPSPRPAAGAAPLLRLGPGGDYTRELSPDPAGRLTDVTA